MTYYKSQRKTETRFCRGGGAVSIRRRILPKKIFFSDFLRSLKYQIMNFQTLICDFISLSILQPWRFGKPIGANFGKGEMNILGSFVAKATGNVKKWSNFFFVCKYMKSILSWKGKSKTSFVFDLSLIL